MSAYVVFMRTKTTDQKELEKYASSGKTVGDSRGIMAGIADHPHEFALPFSAPQAGAHCVE
jgi:hypothetical protein